MMSYVSNHACQIVWHHRQETKSNSLTSDCGVRPWPTRAACCACSSRASTVNRLSCGGQSREETRHMPATRTNCARRGDAVYGPDDAFDRANRANRASRIFAEGIFSRHILRSANGGKGPVTMSPDIRTFLN
eukprot:3281106-Pyramimonas_sp.AAC.1